MDVGLVQVSEGPTSSPTVIPVPDDSDRLFIVDQIELIRSSPPTELSTSKLFKLARPSGRR